MTTRPLRTIVAAIVFSVVLGGACAGSKSPPPAAKPKTTTSTAGAEPSLTVAGSGCSEPKPEALDPSSGRHLLPGQPEPTYLTNPPTSGPHKPGTYATGIVDTPIARPVQVAMLEDGGVLLQYGDISGDELATLKTLAADGVTVAPNPDLPAPVVATAWQVKETCAGVQLPALRLFISTYVNPKKAHG